MSGGICTVAVNAALEELARYGGADGPDPEKAMCYAILAALAEQERHEADDRAHARRRDDPRRLVETKTLLNLNAAQERGEARAHARVRVCLHCQDHYGPGGEERS